MHKQSNQSQRILEEFKRLLVQKDVEDITIKEITDNLQINRSTFYYHYHDKFELMEAYIFEALGFFYISPLNCIDAPVLLREASDKIIRERACLASVFRYSGQNSCFKIILSVADDFQKLLTGKPTFTPLIEQLHMSYTYTTLHLIYYWTIGKMNKNTDAALLARAFYELCPPLLREIYGWQKWEYSE